MTGYQTSDLEALVRSAAPWLLRMVRVYGDTIAARNGARPTLPPDVREFLTLLERFTAAERAGVHTASSATGTTSCTVIDVRLGTVTAAAAVTGKSPSYIRRLARDGRVRCQKVGSTWAVDVDGVRRTVRREKAS